MSTQPLFTPARIEIVAIGTPIPQGSAKAINVPGLNYTVIVSDNPKLRTWRRKVRNAAKAAMRTANAEPFARDIPLVLQAQCCFRRPKSVTREHMTVKPDVSKLLRAVEDALTGVVYADDAQLVRSWARKRYGDVARVEIRVEVA